MPYNKIILIVLSYLWNKAKDDLPFIIKDQMPLELVQSLTVVRKKTSSRMFMPSTVLFHLPFLVLSS